MLWQLQDLILSLNFQSFLSTVGPFFQLPTVEKEVITLGMFLIN